MLKSYRPFSTVFTHYLAHRDQLTVQMTRFSAGFILDNHLRDAKEEIEKIKLLIDEVESRRNESKSLR